jgi:hypothetical protein
MQLINPEVIVYNNKQETGWREICIELSRIISSHLPDAENKIWHAQPVWFLEGNPIVGYSKLKNCVRLLFWSGRSFEEPELKEVGNFQTAEVRFTSVDQINEDDLKRWLQKSREIQWDYKNIVKRKGRLEKLNREP